MNDGSEPDRNYVSQEGGDHYQAEYQHWDWVTDIGMGYLAGNATKYVTRWRKKNGLQDLKKAMTYVDKIIARWENVWTDSPFPVDNIDFLNEKFIRINQIPAAEAHFCILLSDLSEAQYLNRVKAAKEVLSQLIADAGEARTGAQAVAGTTPAPTRSTAL